MLLAAGGLWLAGLMAAAGWAAAGEKDQTLEVYWVDVEGGAATLIVTPAGESVLIDTGNPGRRDPDRIVKVATEVAGLKKLDHLIITHYHGDHYGGAVTLASLLPIEQVWDNGEFPELTEPPSKPYREFPCRARHQIKPGEALPLKQLAGAPALSLKCLGARKEFITQADAPANDALCASAREKARDGSDNANSIVLLLGFGGFRFFDAGDLTWNQEARLVCPQNLVGPVDVYQVTHHGLDASNNPLVLRSLAPTVAIMNNGVTKGCLPEVFANLKETPSLEALYQVHKNLRPDGAKNNAPEEYIANRERECAGNYIRLSVAADAKSYTVSIPANKHSRTFATRPGAAP